MAYEEQVISQPAVSSDEMFAALRRVATFSSLRAADMDLLEGVERISVADGAPLPFHLAAFYAVLSGSVEVLKDEGDDRSTVASIVAGQTFGEVLLLLNKPVDHHTALAVGNTVVVLFPTETFWRVLSHLPSVREAILRDFSHRYQSYQAMALHREKLISLGTLAAGLMHELNNPGTAASRAAAQLRENILRLQHISLRMTRAQLNPEQLGCLADLQEHAMIAPTQKSLSALELSDREEQMTAWLEDAGVENAWSIAPVMVNVGWESEDIVCARSSFADGVFSDALNYLTTLIQSLQLVTTVEESISRVGDLVSAVKKHAYNDSRKSQLLDIRDTLLSTLTILGHKFRSKSIHLEKNFPAESLLVSCRGVGLAQVWTNLLDNAIDASPEGGTVKLRLWTENGQICVGIADNGPGIPQEHQTHIFEAFYTTKEEGVGTGLGLDIARRIVVERFRGELVFTTEPGSTEFIVRLPMASAETEGTACFMGSNSRL